MGVKVIGGGAIGLGDGGVVETGGGA